MRWLKPLISTALVVAAVGIAFATLLSDHDADYGEVPLPPGGTVQLPDGEVTIFFHQRGNVRRTSGRAALPLAFQVVPAGGGPALPLRSPNGSEIQSETSVQRSATVGELGAIAKLDVPAEGAYVVHGTSGFPAGSAFISLGTNAGVALADRWKLLAGLVGAAALISLIPVPRRAKRWGDPDQPTGWSSDSTAPYTRADTEPPAP